MTRDWRAEDRVRALQFTAVEAALEAAATFEDPDDFYDHVGMSKPSKSYFVEHAGKSHSLKAVVAHALQQNDRSAASRDFHAKTAAVTLAALGFTIRHHNAEMELLQREKVWLQRLSRTGQRAFRENLIRIYQCCAITGTTTISVLEAAHVNPVAQNGVDEIENGILLRVDLHKLFDVDLLAIDPSNGQISLADRCAKDYRPLLAERKVFSPPSGGPSLKMFRKRWNDHLKIRSSDALR